MDWSLLDQIVLVASLFLGLEIGRLRIQKRQPTLENLGAFQLSQDLLETLSPTTESAVCLLLASLHLVQPEWAAGPFFSLKTESDDSILRLAKADGIVSK